MRICSSCGYSNEDFSTICSSCGFPLESPADTSLGVEEQTDAYHEEMMDMDMQPLSTKVNGLAVTSLILGILSIPIGFFCFGPVLSILAIIFGFMARSQIKKQEHLEGGYKMALAGIITGFAGIALFIIMVVILFFYSMWFLNGFTGF
ncbi:MAG: DUF4190 domain-containing protein [Clostridium sp.]|nr:DUF4190 domain-containing protein [Clostridium sp.]